MKKTHKEYGDTASPITSKPDILSKVCIVLGLTGLIVFLLWAGVVADALIGLIEMV